MAAMKMKAMKVMKKPSSGVSSERMCRHLPARFKRTLKRNERQFWKALQGILAHTWMKYEQKIADLKECLASEVLAEFGFC